MNYWLMKSEPTTFSIDDLKALPGKTDCWEGVRNYQARNMIRDDMKKGDKALFYHSNCQPPGVVGIMTLVSNPYPDETAFDPKSPYYDPKSDRDNPRWFLVDVKYQKKFKSLISLGELREQKALADLPLLRKGNRLSIMPVKKVEWDKIIEMSETA